MGGANVLLLDEPTNHFDIASCEVLERALEAFGGTILIVTAVSSVFFKEILDRRQMAGLFLLAVSIILLNL